MIEKLRYVEDAVKLTAQYKGDIQSIEGQLEASVNATKSVKDFSRSYAVLASALTKLSALHALEAQVCVQFSEHTNLARCLASITSSTHVLETSISRSLIKICHLATKHVPSRFTARVQQIEAALKNYVVASSVSTHVMVHGDKTVTPTAYFFLESATNLDNDSEDIIVAVQERDGKEYTAVMQDIVLPEQIDGKEGDALAVTKDLMAEIGFEAPLWLHDSDATEVFDPMSYVASVGVSEKTRQLVFSLAATKKITQDIAHKVAKQLVGNVKEKLALRASDMSPKISLIGRSYVLRMELRKGAGTAAGAHELAAKYSLSEESTKLLSSLVGG